MQGLTQMYEPNYDLLLKETEKNQRRTDEKTTFHLVQQPFKISTNLVVMLIISRLLLFRAFALLTHSTRSKDINKKDVIRASFFI